MKPTTRDSELNKKYFSIIQPMGILEIRSELRESIKVHGKEHTYTLLQNKTFASKRTNKPVAFNGISRRAGDLEKMLVYFDDNFNNL